MELVKSRGFTLIEVVVALTILGVGLIVIIELFSGGLRLGRAAEEFSRAASLARMKMEEISLATRVEEGNEAGEFDRDFRWQVVVEKVDLLPAEKGIDFRPPVELYLVKVEVIWKSGAKERSTSLEFHKIGQGERQGARQG